MGYGLILISWLLRTYGAVQEERDALETPLALQGDGIKTILVLMWIILLVAGFYLIFSKDGIMPLLITLVVYFILAPLLLGKLLKRLMDKVGF